MATREEALPYYKWLWQHWRSNRKVQRMGYIAKGLYRELLDEAWVEGSIPNDMNALADICGCPIEVMEEAWPRIVVCWIINEHGRWINEKLESLRTEADAIRVIKAESGRLGGLAKTRVALVSGHAPAEDISRLQKAEDQARDGLAGAKQQLADAKHVLADASECHIEEEEKKKSKRREKPSGEISPGDARHTPFRLAIVEAWPDGEPPWNGRDGSALSKLLAANPKLTLEGFRRLLKHRRDSEVVNLTARPFSWLERVTDYGGGPLDRYGRPLQLGKPSTPIPSLKFVTPEEMHR